MNGVVNGIVGVLIGKVPWWLIIMLVSMIPLLELRGSILAAGIISSIGVAENITFLPTYIWAVIGNMIPIPFILFFITKIFDWMKTKNGLGKIALWFEKKAMSKSDSIQKYGKFGLYLFVAIPLPGTGAWTGSLVAVLLNMKPREAFIPIFLGVMTAGLIMSLISFGIIGAIF